MELTSAKTAVVTGAASGIGFALAERFARAGLDIVMADVEQEALDAAAQKIAVLGVQTLAVRTDVSDEAAVRSLAAAAVERFGAVHVVCNNAGVESSARGTGRPAWGSSRHRGSAPKWRKGMSGRRSRKQSSRPRSPGLWRTRSLLASSGCSPGKSGWTSLSSDGTASPRVRTRRSACKSPACRRQARSPTKSGTCSPRHWAASDLVSRYQELGLEAVPPRGWLQSIR